MKMKSDQKYTGLEIAIIGMACRLPGARNWREYWNNLINGIESVRFFSDQELIELGLEEELIKQPNFVRAKADFKNKDLFDSSFFGYRPVEASLMNPVHRIFHECIWEALEDAGINPDHTKGAIGLYAGAGEDLNWKLYTKIKNSSGEIDDFTLSHLNDKDYLATLLSYKLNLKGPSLSVNTACSTSLVAVNLACKSLLLGETKIALAGGISVASYPENGYLHEDGIVFSGDGHCRAFDKNASGTIGSDGAGIVVLKRLSDALNEGDHIYAVIKGSAINNDGSRKIGFAAPSVEGQADCIKKAQKFAKVEPETISYVETHGTGTNLGDPIEVEALNIAFNKNKTQACALGSVKTNIGHTWLAAGVAGLMKAALSLYYKKIPASLHYNEPNPEIDFKGGPFYVNAALQEWKRKDDLPLRAGVSSFGIGGTNAHAIVEEAPEQEQNDVGRVFKLLTLSAKTEHALLRYIEDLKTFIQQEPSVNPADMSYTTQVGRKSFLYRKSIVYRDKQELSTLLDPDKLKKQLIKSRDKNNAIVFMFSGAGSQYVNMGKDLYENEPFFKAEMDKGFAILEKLSGENYKDIFYPASPDDLRINNMLHTQPAIFLFGYSLARLLMHWKITPQFMIGHSIGEYVAACLSGVFSYEDALKLVVRRGQLLDQTPLGTMLSVPLKEAEAIRYINEHVSLAAINGPDQVVFSGDIHSIDELKKTLEASGISCIKLHATHAGHSHFIDGIREAFGEVLKTITMHSPKVPFLSNLTGKMIREEEASSVEYWLRHIRETVKFSDEIKTLLAQEPGLIFIEMGGGHSLTTLVRQQQTEKIQPVSINLIRHAKETESDTKYLTDRIGQLWSHGISIDWNVYYADEKRKKISLPTYSFEPTRYLAEVDSSKYVTTQSLNPVFNFKDSFSELKDVTSGSPNKMERPELSLNFVEPTTDSENKLKTLFENFFGIKKIGVEDNFFEIGGDSLKGMLLINRIKKEFNVNLLLQVFFTKPTIREIAAEIDQLKLVPGNSETNGEIPLLAFQPDYALSSSQRRLWVLSQFEESSIAYNLPGVNVFEGMLDRDALEFAFQTLIKRHESLRTVFKEDEQGMIRQFIHTPQENQFKIAFYDLRQEKERETQIKTLVNKEFIKPFDLESGPLFRANLYQVENDKWVFSYVMHHIISDGLSMEVMMKELLLFYTAAIHKKADPLPPLRIQYKDYAAWQQEQLKNDALQDHKTYWLKQFDGELPVLELRGDRARPAVQTFNGGTISKRFNPGLSKAIRAFSQKQGGTLFMGLLATVKTLLYRYTNQEDIIIGSPIAGREHADLEDQIGFYVNTLAFRTQFKGSDSFKDLFQNIKQMTLNGYAHQMYPFDDLVDELRLQRDMSRSALFDVMVVLQNKERDQLEASLSDSISVSAYKNIENSISMFDLSFDFVATAEDLEVIVEYNSDIFDRSTVTRLVNHLEQLLSASIAHPFIPIRDLDYLCEQEKQELLVTFNGATSEHLKDKTIVDLFQDQVKRTPNGIAVVFNETSLTYKTLNQLSNQLANYLRENYQLKPDELVGIKLERSEWMVIAILAVLKSGAAYLSIDPEFPESRVEYILKDSGCKAVIDETELSRFQQNENAYKKQNLKSINDPNDLCYVIYTSGSTGQPKGVMIEHLSLVNKLLEEAQLLKADHSVKTCLITNFTFDVSLLELFLPLINGGQIVIPSKEIFSSGEDLLNFLQEKAITILQGTPSFMDYLVGLQTQELTGFKHLKHLCIGGEPLTAKLVSKLKELFPAAHLNNHYGPTETTIDAIVACNINDFPVNRLGKPIGNVKTYILDPHHNILPIGVVGEICIAGNGLARGYLNKPDLTAEKFIPNPFNAAERIYKSGDLGRFLPDGSIEFIGRTDNQVKIRGYRMELGEIENALQSHPDIDSAVVTVITAKGGEKELVAYLTGKKVLNTTSLKRDLNKVLPAYMLPAHFVQLETFPLTSNGKVDKKKLPEPHALAMTTGTAYVAPGNEAERLLVAVFEETLKKQNIGIEDDFFVLGGDSIKSIQIVSRLKQRGYSLTIRDILLYPVIKNLAERIQLTGRAIDQGIVEGIIPLSPIQASFFQSNLTDLHHFNQSVLLYSRTPLSETGIKAAIDKIVLHHDALRMVYDQTEGEWIQKNKGAEQRYSFEIFEATDDAAMLAHCERIQSGISLQNGPLVNVALFRGSTGDRLLLVIHHLVIDGVSWRILLEDLSTLYQQFISGAALTLPLKTDSFKYWQDKQLEYSNSKALMKEEAYWSAIEAMHIEPLPVDNPGERNIMEDLHTVSFSLNEKYTQALLTKCYKAYRTEVNDILLTALTLALQKEFKMKNVFIQLEGHGREAIDADIDVSRTIGWFTTVYPVVFKTQDEQDAIWQLITVKECLHRVPNKGIGYGVLRYLTKKEYRLHPEITFNYLGDFGYELHTGEAEALFEFSADSHGNSISKRMQRDAVLDISGMVLKGKLNLSIGYSARQYDAVTMEKLLSCYRQELEELINKLSAEEKVRLTPVDLSYKELSMEQIEQLNNLV
jgi:amino acid adenylation domain-containing protein/non-ribosomal peptide synthase protein (TIGR01720 family)